MESLLASFTAKHSAAAAASDAKAAGAAAATLEATPHHCSWCWRHLHAILVEGGATAPAPPSIDTAAVAPFFVTLKQRDGTLRGCIGSLTARPLADLVHFASKSAFHDRRFAPVRASELPGLALTVSLLVRYEPAAHPLDWEVGVHGIIIRFAVEGEEFSATYLPEVAAEQGWDQREAVESLVRKAGYHSRRGLPRAAWDAMAVTRYQSSTHSLSYEEWRLASHREAGSAAAAGSAVVAGASGAGRR